MLKLAKKTLNFKTMVIYKSKERNNNKKKHVFLNNTKKNNSFKENNKQIKHFKISFGPQHPAAHDVLKLLLKCPNEIKTKANPRHSLIQRAKEKKTKKRLQTNFNISKKEYQNLLLAEIILSPIFNKILKAQIKPSANVKTLLVVDSILNNIVNQLLKMLKQCANFDTIVITAFVLYLKAAFLNCANSNDSTIKRLAKNAGSVSKNFNLAIAKLYYEKLNSNKFVILDRKKIAFVFDDELFFEPAPLLCDYLPYFLLQTFPLITLKEFKIVCKKYNKLKFLKINYPLSLFKIDCPILITNDGNANSIPTNKLQNCYNSDLVKLIGKKRSRHLLSKFIIRRLFLFGKFLNMGEICISFFLTKRQVQKRNVQQLYRLKSYDSKDLRNYWASLTVNWVKYRLIILKYFLKKNNIKINFKPIFDLLKMYKAFLMENIQYSAKVLAKIANSVAEHHYLHDHHALKITLPNERALYKKQYFVLPKHFFKFLKSKLPIFYEKNINNLKIGSMVAPVAQIDKQFHSLGFKVNWAWVNDQKIINSIVLKKIKDSDIGKRDLNNAYIKNLIKSFLTKQLANYDKIAHCKKDAEFLSPFHKLKSNDLLLPAGDIFNFYDNANKFNYYGHNFMALAKIEDNLFIKLGGGEKLIADFNGCITGQRGDKYHKKNILSKQEQFFLNSFTILNCKRFLVELNNIAYFKPTITKLIDSMIDKKINEELVLVIGITQPDCSSSLSFVSLRNGCLKQIMLHLASFFTYSNGYLTFFGVVKKLELLQKLKTNNLLFKKLKSPNFDFSDSFGYNTFMFKNKNLYKKTVDDLLTSTILYSNFSFIFVQQFFLEFRLCLNLQFYNNYQQLECLNLQLDKNDKFLNNSIKNYNIYYKKSCSLTFSLAFIEYSGKFLMFIVPGSLSKKTNYKFLVGTGKHNIKLKKLFQMHDDAKVKAILHLKCDNKQTFQNFNAHFKTILTQLNLVSTNILNLNAEQGSQFFFNITDFSEKNKILALCCKAAHAFPEIGPDNYMLEPSDNLKNYTQTFQNLFSTNVLKK